MARTRFNIVKSVFDGKRLAKIKKEKILIFTVFIMTIFARSYYLYSAIYHNFIHSVQIEIFTNMVKSAILTLPVIVSSLYFFSRMTRFIAGISILYSIYILFRTHFIMDRLENNGLIVLIVTGMLLSTIGTFCLSDRAWHQSARVFLVAIVAWVLSPLLFAWIHSDQTTRRTLAIERVVRHPPKAVVVLILDEMSPELAPLLRPVLTSQDHIFHVGQVQKAGKDTIYAIPSMLTSKRHDDVAACGATRLCGADFFDMALLRAARTDIDLVGFFHPYCTIQGLRSCWIPLPTDASSAVIFNNMTAQLHLVTGGLIPKLKEPAAKWSAESTRRAIAQHALNAPFWSEGGGMLYVHQYLPHPDGVADGFSLHEEYHMKMRRAVRFVSQIKNKLQGHFGKEYMLIVTSDHPLRTSMWCSKPAYESSNCANENFRETKNVPFIVLAPRNVRVTIPTTNVGLFSPAR